ncbi:MAG: tetratricopeptide repeat protein, partial [Bradymonadaceae bacterium]
VGPSSEAAAQSLDELIEDAKGFDDRVERLENKYLKPAILESRYKLETRFNDARVAYMMEEYDRASLLFADVVRDSDFDEFGSQRAALYLLGDSLYQRRNYLSAKKYYQRVVDRGPGDYYQDAVVGLLEVAAKTGDYKGVDKLYERFDREREMSAAVNYMRGKTLFEREKYEKAVAFFNRAAEADKWAHRARYFKGVCLAGAEKYPDSRDVFRSLVEDLDASDSRQRNLLHLSWLALGRVAYEQGKFADAINLYQRLPRSSQHFDQALYELTWVLVSRKDYKAASRNADIFLYLSNPDPT